MTDPGVGEEYVLVKKGQMPDWSESNTTGQFTGLDPNTEYDLYAQKMATDTSFASEPVKTEVRTSVKINEPVITGEGKGKDGNTAPKPEASDADGETVTFIGTYGEEYTPIIIVDGQEMEHGAEMTWDEDRGEGNWEYILAIPDNAAEAGITVEFRKRTVTGITVTSAALTIYADNAANESIAALTTYLKENSSVQAVYDNKTNGGVQADYTTTDSFAVKGAAYSYTVSAGGKTGGITLNVTPVNAAITVPMELMKDQKAEGYTAEEVAAWLPAQVIVTYTGDGYTARTESRAVAWKTDSIGTDFGAVLGKKTISGTMALPAWATGQDSVSIGIEFVDKNNADETPSSGGNDDDENDGGNDSDDSGDGSDNNGTNIPGNNSDNNGASTPGDNSNSGRPAVTPPPVTPPADTKQPVSGTEGSSGKTTETQPAPTNQEGTPEQGAEPKDTNTDKPRQDSEPKPEQQTENAAAQIVSESMQGENAKCGLCHICPTFLGICCFIWLAVIAAVIFVAVIMILRRKKERE